MTYPHLVQATVDDWARSHGFVKHSGSWYRLYRVAQVVLQVQKSQYGPQYYLNVGLWLTDLGDAKYPKMELCHVRGRIEDLMPDEDADSIDDLLDLEAEIDAEKRVKELSVLLSEWLEPLMEAASESISAIQASKSGGLLISNGLVKTGAGALVWD